MPETASDAAAAPLSDRRRKLLTLSAQPDSVFGLFVRSAAKITESEFAAISLVGEQQQWFKAPLGIDALSIPLEMSFCAHGVQCGAMFEVPDTLADPRFEHHPLVSGAAGVRSYAGHPIEFDGEVLRSVLLAIGLKTAPETTKPGRTSYVAESVAPKSPFRSSVIRSAGVRLQRNFG